MVIFGRNKRRDKYAKKNNVICGHLYDGDGVYEPCIDE
jgi:hypothetical protein